MPPVPFRACLIAICLGLGLHAVEPDSRLAAMRAAAAAARPYVAPAPVVMSLAAAVGDIAIAGVTLVAPADPLAVPRYGRVELQVAMAAMRGTDPFDPDPVAGGVDLVATFTGPSGTWTIPGYYDGTDWRVRFAPDATGAWTSSVSITDSSGTATAAGPAFTCVASASHGWVRVSGNRLVHADGTPFFAVGHNNGWQPNVEQPAFIDMAARGERLLSFWLYAPWETDARGPIERVDAGGTWTYSMAPCQYIDGVIDRAEAAGCFVLPTIWSHDELRGPVPEHDWGTANWASNAYKSICGLNDASLFFDVGGGASAQWRKQQAYLRYLTARWGSSAAVIGWVALAEAEGTSAWVDEFGTRPLIGSWAAEVRNWFVAHDPYRSSAGRHPVAFSTTNSVAWQPAAAAAIDLLSYDSYGMKDDDLAVADEMATEVLTMTAAARPSFHTEYGGNISLGATQPTHLHNATWAALAAGAALPPLLWCDGQNVNPVPTPAPANLMTYPMLTDATNGGPAMRDHLDFVARFAGLVPWLTDAGMASTKTTLDDGITMRIVRTDPGVASDRGFAWFHRSDGSLMLPGTTALPVPIPKDGNYVIWWYDAWTGNEVRLDAAASSVAGVLDLVAPTALPSRRDLVVSWQEYVVPAAPADLRVAVAPGARITITLAGAVIASLPATGTLYQALDATTPGAAITAVPAIVTDPGMRVIYQAPAAPALTAMTVKAKDGRLVSAPATVTLDTTYYGTGPGGITQIQFDSGSGCGVGAGGASLLVGGLLLLGLRRRRR